MFSKSVLTDTKGPRRTGVILLALTIMVLAVPSSFSQYFGYPWVSTDLVHGVHLGQPFSVGINILNHPEMQIGGFDFLLAYDANLATLTGAQPGQLMTDCDWEYFTYRTLPVDSCNGDCPSGMVRVVAVADINNGAPYPTCFGEQGGQLAYLEFVATSDSSQHCQEIPVVFFWLDCGDNVMSSITGDSLYVSDYVEGDGPWSPPVDTFPNYTGTPEHCIDSSQGTITRGIDFSGNGARLYCLDTIGNRGDLNLNGIPFEIADWALFANYFVYGLSVFTIDPELQIAASDCNGDGLVLTVADLVFLGRVLVGDEPPPPSPPNRSTEPVVLIQDTVAHTVSVQFSDSLSALHLVFAGEVVPTLDLPGHITDAVFDATVTRVLIAPDLDTLSYLPLISSGLLFSYTGDGQLMAADAAYDGLSVIPTIIQGSSIPDCCILPGNMNGDGQIDVTDLTYTVDYLFGGGPPPPCMLEANIDGLGALMDVSDLVYLVDYLFRGGQPPVPCP